MEKQIEINNKCKDLDYETFIEEIKFENQNKIENKEMIQEEVNDEIEILKTTEFLKDINEVISNTDDNFSEYSELNFEEDMENINNEEIEDGDWLVV